MLREWIIECISSNPGATGRQIRSFVAERGGPTSESNIRSVLDSLEKENIVDDRGWTKRHAYYLKNSKQEERNISEQLRKQKRQREMQSEINRLSEKLAEEKARQKILDYISNIDSEPRSIIPREKASGNREGALVVLASDWHVEEEVLPEEVAGMNQYNLEIAEKRACKFFRGIKWLLEYHRTGTVRYQIKDLILWLGGDLITNHLHPENVESNYLGPTEAILFARDLLIDGINSLLEDNELERIIVPCSSGNHGRFTEKTRHKTGSSHSLEWLMYRVLADQYKDEPRVQFHVPKSAHCYIKAYGRDLHFTHGDQVKGGGGVGGIAVPLLRRIPKWDSFRRCDYHHIGHFHQVRDFHSVLVNGSLIGFNAYAISIGASYETPAQLSYVLDSKRGKTLSSPIWLEENEEEKDHEFGPVKMRGS